VGPNADDVSARGLAPLSGDLESSNCKASEEESAEEHSRSDCGGVYGLEIRRRGTRFPFVLASYGICLFWVWPYGSSEENVRPDMGISENIGLEM
jgi:hypothetical protein